MLLAKDRWSAWPNDITPGVNKTAEQQAIQSKPISNPKQYHRTEENKLLWKRDQINC